MADLTINAKVKSEGSDKFFNSMSSGFTKLAGLAATVGATIGAWNIGKKIIDITASFEKYNAVLTNTFQSAKAAAQAQQLIQDIAAKTPFTVNELTASYVKLANRGFAPTRKEIMSLGDLASATGKSFDDLVEAVLDAEGAEFERLKEFGIKSKKQGKDVAFTFKGTTKVVENNAASIRKYILSLGDLKGVTGGMEAQSKTLGGRLSLLNDAMDNLYLTIGDKISPVLTPLIKQLAEFVGTIGPKISSTFAAITNSPIAKFLKEEVADHFERIKVIVGTVIDVIQNARDKFMSFYETSEFLQGFVANIKGAFVAIKATISPMVTFIGGVINWIVDLFTDNPIGQAITETILKPINWIISGIKKMAGFLTSTFTKLNSFFGFDTKTFEMPKVITVKTDKGDAEAGGGIDLQKVLNTVNAPAGSTAASSASKGSNTSTLRAAASKAVTINIGNVVESMAISQNEDPLVIADMVKKALLSTVADTQNY